MRPILVYHSSASSESHQITVQPDVPKTQYPVKYLLFSCINRFFVASVMLQFEARFRTASRILPLLQATRSKTSQTLAASFSLSFMVFLSPISANAAFTTLTSDTSSRVVTICVSYSGGFRFTSRPGNSLGPSS